MLDCNKYRVNLPTIKSLTHKLTEKERLEACGMIAVSTGVPIIVVLCYIGELYGFSSAVNEMIERLKLFYGVSSIANIKNT